MKWNIKKIWKKHREILEGITNATFKNEHVEQIAELRKQICETNVCGHYDAEGKSEICYFPGNPCCSACGCKLSWKQRSLSDSCGLKDLGKDPLWESVMTDQDEKEFRERTGIKNES